MSEAVDTLAQYWEQRALKYARDSDGLAAVCSYGMPRFYNRSIEICQRHALQPWLQQLRNCDLLEVGCGVGRWTEQLVANGNHVCAVDVSPTMIAETRNRLNRRNLSAELHVADIACFDAGRQFDAALSVTVIQHLTDEQKFARVFHRIAAQLRPDARLLLLEAAPAEANTRCDSPFFRARPLSVYLRSLEHSGFRIDTVAGVDPIPFKTWLLPYLRSLPRPLAVAAVAAATALSLPLDLLLARQLTTLSWHKVIAATRHCQ